MFPSFVTLFSPASTTAYPLVQATCLKPPAPRSSEDTGEHSSSRPVNRLPFMVRVAGDAVGFTGLVAGCWFGLQVLQAFVVT